MEKRAILAVVLSFLIILLWSFLMSPKQEESHRQEEVRGTEELQGMSEPPATTPGTPPSVQGPEKTATSPIAAQPEKEIVVDTPLYRAVFSNAGPTIRSFELKKYRKTIDPKSPPVEMVTLEKNMGDFLVVGFDHPSEPQPEKLIYQVDQQAIHLDSQSPPSELVFRSLSREGVSIHQTFRLYPDQYRIDLAVKVVNQSDRSIQGAFVADLKALPPSEKRSYYAYVGLLLLLNDELEEVEVKKVSEQKTMNGLIEWMAYEDDYFISAIVPEKEIEGAFKGSLLSSGVLNASLLPPPVTLNPHGQVSTRYMLYLGPRDLWILKELGNSLEQAVNFGWTDIIARPLLYVLRFFNQYLHNYGLSIILLTILVRILFWPLTQKSYKSMKEMQKLQPRMAKLREKYKDNKEQLNKELMNLYRTYKINPMGGCLPMVIQIPVFFALFRLLGSAIELRHAPFMLWIDDLSAPDRLFHFPFQIPFMAPPSGIPVLTLLMGASMFIQQKMTPTPGDPTQAKIMMFLPIIFTFMFINFPSGLVLYWFVSNILTIGQQYRIQKRPG